jgi:hypothetical protein
MSRWSAADVLAFVLIAAGLLALGIEIVLLVMGAMELLS